MYKETADDLARKYDSTFLLLDDKLVYVREFGHVDIDSKPVAFSYKTAHKDKWSNEVWDESKIKVIQPDAMLFNRCKIGSSSQIAAIQYCRSGRRQYKRSICSDNSIFSNPIQSLYYSLGINCHGFDPSISWEFVQGLLNTEYPNLDKAVEYLPKHQGIALSPQHGISLSNLDDGYLLFNLFGYIGTYKNKCAKIFYPPAYQEFRDYIHRTNQSIEVQLWQDLDGLT